LLDDLDAYLLAHRRLVARGRKGVAPLRVVRLLQLRQSMADSLDRILAGLGGDRSAGSRDRARGRRDVADPPSSIAELVARVGGVGPAGPPRPARASPAWGRDRRDGGCAGASPGGLPDGLGGFPPPTEGEKWALRGTPGPPA